MPVTEPVVSLLSRGPMKKQPITWMARQGDILLTAVLSIPKDAKAHVRAADHGRVVLAYGEVTGHAHALAEGTVTAYGPSDDAFWLEVEQPGQAVVTHEEHAAIALPANVRFLSVRRQRQYTPERIERVAD